MVMENWIIDFFNSFFTSYNNVLLFFLSTFHFAFIYFIGGWLFWKMCRSLLYFGYMEKINEKLFSKGQLLFEIRHSIYSILVFGFSALPLAYFIQNDVIHLRENTLTNIIVGLVILTIWNEIHFYIIHKTLHIPLLMKHIHKIHHRSVVPSVFSVYSFHPVEAFLLSSVLVTIAPLYNFCSAALMLFPTVSIVINFVGHSNYRLKISSRFQWLLFASKHNEHHGIARREYGFMANFMDKYFTENK
jgi:Delta7-sterol 5-desaturase